MDSFKISVQSIATHEVNIINNVPLVGEPMQVNINRNIRKTEDSCFLCLLSASIYKDDEKSKDEKSFLVKYVLKSVVSCDNPLASAEQVQDAITKELYPFLRSGVSAVMGASGIEPILLPIFN